jgi:hypothetical protein
MKSGSFSGCMIKVTADSREQGAGSRRPTADRCPRTYLMESRGQKDEIASLQRARLAMTVLCDLSSRALRSSLPATLCHHECWSMDVVAMKLRLLRRKGRVSQ